MAQLENFRLKVFRAVAEQLNFRKAAEQLFLTQPAVTQQIQALENDLGMRLFDRTAKGVALTAKGAILLGHAKRMAEIAIRAEQELGADAGQCAGELALGVSTTIAQYVLPRLIGAFLGEHPRVQLSLQSGNTREVVESVLVGRVAIGLIEGPAEQRSVHTEAFMQDELVLIARADGEPAKYSEGRLLGSSLLMREQGSGSRRVVESALEKSGFRLKAFKSVMNLDSTEAIKSAVEAGLGIGFVSRWAIAKELELGVLQVGEVRGLKMQRDFSLVTRTGPLEPGPASAFRAFALAHGKLISNGPQKG